MTLQTGAVVPLGHGLPWADTSDHRGRPLLPGASVLRPAEDFALLAELGCTAVRLPLDWARLQPRPGRLDPAAVERFAVLLDAARAAGLAPWGCLFEGALPGWFDDGGGFADERLAAMAWPRFVEQVAEALGHLVDGWVPMEDPGGLADERYRSDPRRHAEVLRTLVVAWRDAWRVLRGGPPVATCLGLAMAYEGSRAEARRRELQRCGVWLDGLRDGVVAVPGLAEREVPDVDGACDVLGVLVAPPGSATPERCGDEVGAVVRHVVEQGPDRPVHLTVRLEPAGERSRFVDAVVHAVLDATADGVALAAAFHWPAVGDPPTGGLVGPDRRPTAAADAWRTLARTPNS